MRTTASHSALACCAMALLAQGCGTAVREATLRVYRTVGDTGTFQTAVGDPRNPPAEVLDPAWIRSRLHPNGPTHLIVLVHGSDPEGVAGEWLEQFRTAVQRRTGLTDPDLRVVILDWAAWSFEGAKRGILLDDARVMRRNGWLAGALGVRLLAEGGHLHADPARRHIHLIGHSRGATIASHMARILSDAGITIGQFTSLDGLDALTPHAELELLADGALRTDLAAFSDNYCCDGFFAGLLDTENFFLSGSPRRNASVNVHFAHFTHVESHDLYMRSIADPTLPWGFQWSKLGGAWDPKRRRNDTLVIPRPKLLVEGPAAVMRGVSAELWHRPPGAGSERLVVATESEPVARYLMPGGWRVVLRERATGRELPAELEVVTHAFDRGPDADTRQVFRGRAVTRLTIGPTDFGVDYVLRPVVGPGGR